MKKVTMPEPVAHVISIGGVPTIYRMIAGPQSLGVGDHLITTDQAEAYKDVCVREALKEAAGIVMNAPITADMIDDDGAKALAIHANAKIRALIPKQ